MGSTGGGGVRGTAGRGKVGSAEETGNISGKRAGSVSWIAKARSADGVTPDVGWQGARRRLA